MEVAFKPSFIRSFKKLPPKLQDEVREKITSFKDPANHDALRVHKLKGALADFKSFSVNYRYRIVFTWDSKDSVAVLLDVGTHSVYE